MYHTLLITGWLAQRQSLLASLYDLCCHRPFFLKMQGEAFQAALQEFGGQILDYLSLGHFKIYETLTTPLGNLPSLIHQLDESTHQILNLQDRYHLHFNIIQLDRDLNFLSERLAKRFELEDRLISLCFSNEREVRKKFHWGHSKY